jgi:hypothetical protein
MSLAHISRWLITATVCCIGTKSSAQCIPLSQASVTFTFSGADGTGTMTASSQGPISILASSNNGVTGLSCALGIVSGVPQFSGFGSFGVATVTDTQLPYYVSQPCPCVPLTGLGIVADQPGQLGATLPSELTLSYCCDVFPFNGITASGSAQWSQSGVTFTGSATGSVGFCTNEECSTEEFNYPGTLTIAVSWTPTQPAVVGIDLSQIPSDWTPLISNLTDVGGSSTDKDSHPVGPPQFVIADAYSGSGGTVWPAYDILTGYQNAVNSIPNGGSPLIAAYVYLGFCPDCYIATDTGGDQVQRALQSVCGGESSPVPCPLEQSLGFMAVDVECTTPQNPGNQCTIWSGELPNNPQIVLNNQTLYQAVQAVQAVNLKPVIYTDKTSWSVMTGAGASGLGSTSFGCIPLWQTRVDNVAELNPALDSPSAFLLPFGGWTTRVAKQYQIDSPQLDVAGSVGNTITIPLTVDLDVIAPFVFTPGVSCTTNPQGCMAQDVSSSVTVVRGFEHINPFTRTYQQPITITNTTASTLPGPVSLVFDNLANATVANGTAFSPSGSTSCTYPAGSSYVNIAPYGLAAGQSVTATMEYTLTGTQGPMFSNRILSGNGTR